MDNPAEMEEERRLCYVGVTRAKERLYLHRVFRRGFRGNFEAGTPSRFLAEIPQELIVPAPSTAAEAMRSAGRMPGPGRESPLRPLAHPATAAGTRRGRAGDGDGRPSRPTGDDASEPRTTLATGDKVRHAVFGDGIVTGCKPSGDDVEVTVAFSEGHGVKRLLLSFAPMEKVE